ncbi:MAG: class I SAM-dependent methyltransferase [Bacteroidales bacterium]|nr:class I SAM-dependent methyltransferase [Bacteroidales bacterium]
MIINLKSLIPDYELLDCGNSAKLERFGDIILIRPEITANKKPVLKLTEWYKLAHAEFVEETKSTGYWKTLKKIPTTWNITYNNYGINLIAELSLTKTKHIGIFPEQVLNWEYIAKMGRENTNINFLNIFGYTGLSSVAAAGFYDKITHIDSIKKVVDWTKKNAELSGYKNIRCITEDAPKFVLREITRKNKYQGIILDPPTIGRGAKNEKWRFEDNIDDLLSSLKEILDKKCFVIMNFYSHTITKKFVHRLILTHFRDFKIDFCDKIYGESNTGNTIDHGFFIRLKR